jgi:hypothetical protein
MATALRVIAFGAASSRCPALIAANIAVTHAFLVVAQRSIELQQGKTGLGALDFAEQFRLSRAVLWRIALLMAAVGCALAGAGFTSLAPHMNGRGSTAWRSNQHTDIGKFWSALIAVLVLLMTIDADAIKVASASSTPNER